MIAAVTASTNVLMAAKPCAIGTSTAGFGRMGGDDANVDNRS